MIWLFDLRTRDMIAHDFKGDIEDINRAVATYCLKLHIWENYARHYVNHYILNINNIGRFKF